MKARSKERMLFCVMLVCLAVCFVCLFLLVIFNMHGWYMAALYVGGAALGGILLPFWLALNRERTAPRRKFICYNNKMERLGEVELKAYLKTSEIIDAICARFSTVLGYIEVGKPGVGQIVFHIITQQVDIAEVFTRLRKDSAKP